MRTLAIAAVQTAPVPFDPEANWERFAEQVRRVRELFPHVQYVACSAAMTFLWRSLDRKCHKLSRFKVCDPINLILK